MRSCLRTMNSNNSTVLGACGTFRGTQAPPPAASCGYFPSRHTGNPHRITASASRRKERCLQCPSASLNLTTYLPSARLAMLMQGTASTNFHAMSFPFFFHLVDVVTTAAAAIADTRVRAFHFSVASRSVAANGPHAGHGFSFSGMTHRSPQSCGLTPP